MQATHSVVGIHYPHSGNQSGMCCLISTCYRKLAIHKIIVINPPSPFMYTVTTECLHSLKWGKAGNEVVSVPDPNQPQHGSHLD